MSDASSAVPQHCSFPRPSLSLLLAACSSYYCLTRRYLTVLMYCTACMMPGITCIVGWDSTVHAPRTVNSRGPHGGGRRTGGATGNTTSQRPQRRIAPGKQHTIIHHSTRLACMAVIQDLTYGSKYIELPLSIRTNERTNERRTTTNDLERSKIDDSSMPFAHHTVSIEQYILITSVSQSCVLLVG
jgi:hypothetical protein